MLIVRRCARPDLSKTMPYHHFFFQTKHIFSLIVSDKYSSSPVFFLNPKTTTRPRPRPPSGWTRNEAGGEPKVSPKKCPGNERWNHESVGVVVVMAWKEVQQNKQGWDGWFLYLLSFSMGFTWVLSQSQLYSFIYPNSLTRLWFQTFFFIKKIRWL